MSKNQLACTYAAFILADSGKTDAATLQAVTKAAGVEITKGMASAFASIMKDADLSKILGNISFAGGAAAAPAAAAGAAPAAAKKEEKAPEPEEEDDFGMGGLF